MSAPQHLGDELSAYLDGELGAEERAAVAAHLGECASCAQRLEELASVDSFARALPAQAPESYFEAFPARVRQRLAARRVRRVPPAWTWAAAAAVLLAVVTPLTMQRDSSPAPTKANMERAQPESSRRAQRAAPPAAAPSPAPPATRTGEQEERLRALGYASGAGARDAQQQRGVLEKQDAAVRQRLRERDAYAAPSQSNGVVGGVVGGLPAAVPPPVTADGELKDGRRKKESFVEGPGADKLARNLPAPAAPPATTLPESVTAEAPQVAARRDESPSKTRAEPAAAPPPPAEEARAQAPAARPSPSEGALRATKDPDRSASLILSTAVAREFEAQASRPVRTAEEAREAARQWEELAKRHPQAPLADEARVRGIEALATAFRLERKEADRDRARKAAEAYLAGSGAHKDRVRALLQVLER